jgi:hypothetical protein
MKVFCQAGLPRAKKTLLWAIMPLFLVLPKALVAAVCAVDHTKVAIALPVVIVPTGAVVVIAHLKGIVQTAPSAAAAKWTADLAGTRVNSNQARSLSLL